jgi:hypothetical protein
MANEFVARNGIISRGDLTISGSISTTSPINLSGFATGSVLFTSGSAGAITGSANLFWDNTNGRLGVGTSSPAYQIDVVGGIRVATGTSFFKTINGGQIIMSSLGDSQPTLLFADNNGNAQYGNIKFYDLSFRNGSATVAKIFSTGNLAINTTTDAGFKLDVNGITRFTGNSTFTANIASVSIECTSGIFAPSGANGVKWGSNVFAISSVNGVLKLSDGTNADFNRLQLGGATSAFPSIKRASNNIEIKNADDTFGAGLSVGASLNASSILQADSTTKGFLPPRMTTTQKNAIASPATGLELYDTTLNQKSYYDGTSWTNVPLTRNEYKSVPATLGGIVGGTGTTNGVVFSTQTPIFKTGGQIIDVDLTYITSTLNVSTNLRVYRSDSPNTIVGASLMDTVNYTFTTGTTDIYADGIRYRKRYFVGLDTGSEIIWVPTQLLAKPNDMYVPLNNSGPTTPLNTLIIANNYLVFSLNQSAKFLGGTITY